MAVNAVSLAPGGGMVVLLGFLGAWRQISPDLKLSIYASRSEVLDAVAQVRPDCQLVPFAKDASSGSHFVRQLTTLGPALDSGGFDVVFSNNLLIGRCRLPQVVHHQNLKRFIPHAFRTHLLGRQWSDAARDIAVRGALRRATLNTFISEYLKEAAERVVPESAPRNHVLPNGIDQLLLDSIREFEPPADSKRFHIVAVQSSTKHKDNPTLIRSFAQVVKSDPALPWELTIAGGGDMNSVRQLAADLGVEQRLRLAGYLTHEQLDPLLRGALCLVFTSVLEGFGNPPLEAMARGCPVVASDCTAIPEVVGDAGILVTPGDPSAFANAVLKLANDATLRSELIQKGLVRVRQFSWNESARKLADLLRQAAQR